MIHEHGVEGPAGGVRRPQPGERRGAVAGGFRGDVPGAEQFAQQLLVNRVVVHDQHAAAGNFFQRRGKRGHARSGGKGDVEPESGSLVRLAFHADGAAHEFDQLFADGEAEAGAAELARGGGVGLGEFVEQQMLFVLGDAEAGVGDGEFDLRLDRRPGQATDFDQHMARRGELDGVVREVEQDLAEADAVGDDARRRAGGDADQKFNLLLARLGREQVGDFLNGGGQIHRQRLEGKLAGLDLREVEDVVDDDEQVGAGVAEDFGEAPLLGGEVGVEQQVGHAEDAVHGRADFMAHHREELALGGAAGLGGGLRLEQAGIVPLAFGNVMDEHQRALMAVEFRGHGADLHLHGMSVQPQEFHFRGGQGNPVGVQLLHVLRGLVAKFRGDEVENLLAQELHVLFRAQQFQQGVVGVGEAAVGLDKDGRGSLVQQGAVAGLAREQRLLGIFLFGDVAGDAQRGENISGLVAQRGDARVQPAAGAFEPDDFIFHAAGDALKHLLVEREKRFAEFFRQPRGDTFSDHLGRRVGLEHRQSGRVHFEQPALHIQQLHTFWLGVEDGAQLEFAFDPRLVGLFAVRDVPAHAHEAVNLAVTVADGNFGGQLGGCSAVQRNDLLLLVDDRFAGQHPLLVGPQPRRRFRRKKIRIRQPHHFGGVLPARPLGHGAVGQQEAAVRVFHVDGVRHQINQRPEQMALLFDRLLGPFAVGDVLGGANDPQGLSGIIQDQPAKAVHPAFLPVVEADDAVFPIKRLVRFHDLVLEVAEHFLPFLGMHGLEPALKIVDERSVRDAENFIHHLRAAPMILPYVIPIGAEPGRLLGFLQHPGGF